MAIPYAPTSWNPITGCSEISAGCKNCWARKVAETRLRGKAGYDAVDPFKITFHEDKLDAPRRWRKPKVVAVDFMGDMFHKDVPNEWRDRVWQVVRDCPQHTFITSTKRPNKMITELTRLGPLKNVWHGITTENQRVAESRLRNWLGIPRLYINYEPALTAIKWQDLRGMRGVIIGAESGPNARPFDPAWAEETQEACSRSGTPFYMKQLAPSMGGANWDKWPDSLKHLKVRQLPWNLESKP